MGLKRIFLDFTKMAESKQDSIRLLYEEKSELQEKISNLSDLLLWNEDVKGDPMQKTLIEQQLDSMALYSVNLTQRILYLQQGSVFWMNQKEV